MDRLITTLALLLLAPAASFGISPKIVDVREAGAIGDGTTLNTAPLQRCLDDCRAAGGGVVRLPAGTYVSGPLTIRSRTTLRLEQGAVLLENVTVTAARAGLEIRHARGVTLRNVVITPGRGEPIVTRDADVERE